MNLLILLIVLIIIIYLGNKTINKNKKKFVSKNSNMIDNSSIFLDLTKK